ncbi:UNVERIFIED_ORG: hypothetical protein ABIB52_004516 [Arthrobacter sp. UYCu721]
MKAARDSLKSPPRAHVERDIRPGPAARQYVTGAQLVIGKQAEASLAADFILG